MAGIFVVDDEVYIQALYRDLLESTGHEIIDVAYNGREAVLTYGSFTLKPDVTLMDHRMPIKNGSEATREILKMDPSAEILVISADPTIEDNVMRIGAAGFMAKPFEVVLLLQTIDGIVSKAKGEVDPQEENGRVHS